MGDGKGNGVDGFLSLLVDQGEGEVALLFKRACAEEQIKFSDAFQIHSADSPSASRADARDHVVRKVFGNETIVVFEELEFLTRTEGVIEVGTLKLAVDARMPLEEVPEFWIFKELKPFPGLTRKDQAADDVFEPLDSVFCGVLRVNETGCAAHLP